MFIIFPKNVNRKTHFVVYISDLDPVEGLKVHPQGDTFFLKWNPPNNTAVTQYVVQWVSANDMDWHDMC